jgi:hypothetical protein
MSNVIALKPKKNVVSILTCPDCGCTDWEIIIANVTLGGNDFYSADMNCKGCEFVTPAILVLPVGDDDDYED